MEAEGARLSATRQREERSRAPAAGSVPGSSFCSAQSRLNKCPRPFFADPAGSRLNTERATDHEFFPLCLHVKWVGSISSVTKTRETGTERELEEEEEEVSTCVRCLSQHPEV